MKVKIKVSKGRLLIIGILLSLVILAGASEPFSLHNIGDISNDNDVNIRSDIKIRLSEITLGVNENDCNYDFFGSLEWYKKPGMVQYKEEAKKNLVKKDKAQCSTDKVPVKYYIEDTDGPISSMGIKCCRLEFKGKPNE